MTGLKIAVAGSTGLVGGHVTEALQHGGDAAVVIARSRGVDALTGEGLDEALRGVDVVIDVTNTPNTDPDGARSFFGTITTNLLAAERRQGVTHHVAVSIVGVDRVKGTGHYVGKRHQEELVRAGPIQWTVVRATPANGMIEVAGPERHDFVDMARRTLAAKGDRTTMLIPSWQDGPFRAEMAGDVLLPGPQATIAQTTFDDWLTGLRPAGGDD